LPELPKKQYYWLKSSTDLLSSSKTLANASGAFSPIVLIAWQSIENGLKTLAPNADIRDQKNMGHDFGKITRYLVGNNILTDNDLTQIGPHLATASGSATYSDTKYPGDNPSYWDSLTRTQVTNVVSAAESVHDFVLAKLEIPKKDWWDAWSGSTAKKV